MTLFQQAFSSSTCLVVSNNADCNTNCHWLSWLSMSSCLMYPVHRQTDVVLCVSSCGQCMVLIISATLCFCDFVLLLILNFSFVTDLSLIFFFSAIIKFLFWLCIYSLFHCCPLLQTVGGHMSLSITVSIVMTVSCHFQDCNAVASTQIVPEYFLSLLNNLENSLNKNCK